MVGFHWAFWGCGSIAEEMALALAAAGVGVYAVLGRNAQKAAAFAEKHGTRKVYTGEEQLLSDPAVDIVYIATPHNTHYEMIKKALSAGKHVLCEKAITVNSGQLLEVKKLAQEKGLVLLEAMTVLYMPLYQKLREMVDSGAVGRVKMIQVNFGSCKEYDVNSRFFSKELAGGALLDIGGYAVTFARLFLEEQPNVVLTTVDYFETGVDEQSGIILKTNGGQIAVLSLSMRAKQPKRGLVAGEKGYIEVYGYPRADRAAVTYTADGRTQEITAGSSTDALQYEVLAMQEAVRGKCTARLSMSIESMELLDRVRSSWGMKYPFESNMNESVQTYNKRGT